MSADDISPDDISLDAAAELDAADPLPTRRAEFRIPLTADGTEEVYLVGNSLGPQPRRAADRVQAELDAWASRGVRGHTEGDHPWMPYHEFLTGPLARIVGAGEDEVVAMNALTVNLHLLMASFYRPTARRHRILIEEHAFPSDHFAAESQIRWHGLDPASSLVTVGPRPGSDLLDPDDIRDTIARLDDSLALVLLPGVQYYTGQALPLAEITEAAHAVGALVGFDLAHAVGNITLDLHDADVDFAVWCSYKYLNGGPGGVGGCFVHRRHLDDRDVPRLSGWWGTNKATRFEMRTEFDPLPTVEAWQLSNAPILAMAALRGSLEIFDEVGGMAPLRAKALRQIAHLDALLTGRFADEIDIITPREPERRGGQFSLRLKAPIDGRATYAALEAAHVACDWRHPDVIRIAVAPLYTTYADLHRFVAVLDSVLHA